MTVNEDGIRGNIEDAMSWESGMRSVGGTVGCGEVDFGLEPLAVSVGGMINRGRYVRA